MNQRLALTQRIRRSTSDRLFELLRKADELTAAGWRALQNRAIRSELKRRNDESVVEEVNYTHCPFCGFPLIVHAGEMETARRCRQCSARFVPDHAVDPAGKSGRLHPATRPVTRRATLQTRLQQNRRAVI
jgi:hypothetical protein